MRAARAIGVALGVLGASGCVSSLRRALDLPSFEVREARHEDVWVTMRDGVKLASRVHWPDGDGPFPTVLTRYPYPIDGLLDRRCHLLVRYGYVCVRQAVRGQGASEGMWEPFTHEATDGADAIAWIRRQRWSDGQVAMIGESYLAATQWSAAALAPEGLVTIVPSVFGTSAYLMAYEQGLFRHEVATAWMALMPERGMRFSSGGSYRKALATWPRSEMDVAATGLELPWFREWLAHPYPGDPYWQSDLVATVTQAPERTDLPVLMVGGWSDAFLGPMLDTWDRLATKDRSTLVIGPWNHVGGVPSDVPLRGLDGGAHATEDIGQLRHVVAWLDQHLRGAAPGPDVGKAVVYVPGTDAWWVLDQWPPATEATTWSLHGDQEVAQACGGTLTASSPAPEAPGVLSWTHDPLDPVRSRGGAGMLAGIIPFYGGAPQGFREERGLCAARDDVFGFRSSPLDASIAIAGAVTVDLVVAADAPDAAVVVRVLQEAPNGKRVLVREGAATIALRDGAAWPLPYAPGTPVHVGVRTWPIAWSFPAGSRVVVEVTSSSFPKYESHGGTEGPWARVVEPRPVGLSLWPERSAVTLPVWTPPKEQDPSRVGG